MDNAKVVQLIRNVTKRRHTSSGDNKQINDMQNQTWKLKCSWILCNIIW